MTKEIAIHNLFALKLRSRVTSDREALDMAIKALEATSCIKEKCAYCPHCDNCDVDDETLEIKALEQQPNEDCISREEAIKQCGFGMTNLLIADCLRRLPSVTPEPYKAESEE